MGCHFTETNVRIKGNQGRESSAMQNWQFYWKVQLVTRVMNLLGEKKSLSGFFPFPIHCWWKFILQGINTFTWCHLALPNSHGRSQVPYDSSNHGGLADRYERAALSACRSGMKGALHISSSETIGKLQSGKLAMCIINIEDRLCFAWLERNGWGETKWAAEWSPITCDDKLKSSTCFSPLKTEPTCLSMWGLRVSSIFYWFLSTQNTFLRVSFIFWSSSKHCDAASHSFLEVPHIQIFLSNHLSKFFNGTFSPHVFINTFSPCRVQRKSFWIGSNSILIISGCFNKIP